MSERCGLTLSRRQRDVNARDVHLVLVFLLLVPVVVLVLGLWCYPYPGKSGLPMPLHSSSRDRGIREHRCAVTDTMMDELSVICPAGNTRIVARLRLSRHANPPLHCCARTMQW
ncbi:hypothetical protein M514_13679 [Trichuris suis]|uniref:Uncharacterized protein n=1 Tax=Trichuris suis TaxID=68888 RepID=A0A085MSP7_9BILA|nr:hypothetical protein M514_13679 [Trichuris suis]